MIYFVGNEHGAIKIGYTADLNVQKRLWACQTSNADLLTILGYRDGIEIDEGNLHCRFAHLRIRGEWFVATNELLDYILSLPTTGETDVQNWVAAMLPKGNTADLQQLREQIRVKANKQAQDIVKAAHAKADQIIDEAKHKAEQKRKQIIDFATACAASDIKELVTNSCDLPLSDYPCCKCGRARHTVKEREDGFPWCNSCWVNHTIFDSGRFDVIIAQTNDAALYPNVNQGK